MTLSVGIRRSGCAVSCSLDVLGDKWSLLIVRDMLFLGKCYFKEFLASGEGIATNILTDRLRRLEKSGVVTKHSDAENGRRIVYTLTEKGVALIPVIVELVCWGTIYEAAPNDQLSTFDLEKAHRIQRDTRYRRRFIRELRQRCRTTS